MNLTLILAKLVAFEMRTRQKIHPAKSESMAHKICSVQHSFDSLKNTRKKLKKQDQKVWGSSVN